MNKSNSKLNKTEKEDRKYMLAQLRSNGGSVFTSLNTGVTVVVEPAGVVYNVALSVPSKNEQKLRRKVGEYHALLRNESGVHLPFSPLENTTADEIARNVAEVWA